MLAHLLLIRVFRPCLPCQHPSVTRIARKNSDLADLPASRGHPVPGAQRGNPMLRAKCCLASKYLRTISTGRQARVGCARQGAGFHATFSLAAALCDVVWPN